MNRKTLTRSLSEESEAHPRAKKRLTLQELTELWGDGLEKRFMANVVHNRSSGCWEWVGTLHNAGYGFIGIKSIMYLAHRVTYQIWKGKIVPPLEIDHLCRNRKCCNPAHLEAVTRRVNLLRGATLPAANVLKTHCPKGHPCTPENTLKRQGERSGDRDCRLCNLERANRYYSERKHDPEFMKKQREISYRSYHKNKNNKNYGNHV